LRIDDGDRTAFADAETVRLGTQNSTLVGQPELLEAAFQEIPRCQPAVLLAAFWRRLIAAKKNVAPRHRHADTCRDRTLRLNTQGKLSTAEDTVATEDAEIQVIPVSSEAAH